MHLSPLALVSLMLLPASPALAQAASQTAVGSVLRAAVSDPTTYAPAIVAWSATRGDWNSSQFFFQHGFVEDNARFTVSGQSGGAPIGFGAGNRKILGDALAILTNSVINNVADEALTRVLTARYPRHRTLIRTIGWVERGSMASFWTYRQASGHFRQWLANDRRAPQLD
jgi:hypothetical protein